MSFGGTWDDQPVKADIKAKAVKALKAALDCGINFFDHADIYCRGKSETVFAEAAAELGLRRDQMILQTKCGIRFSGDPVASAPQRYDFSYEHIVASAEKSLKRLRIDYIDVYLLHRPDALVEPGEVARAFDYLHKSGKVRHFGLSNHTAAQMELLRKFVRQPIIANQVELSLLHAHLIDAGIVPNQTKHSLGADGTLDYCRLHDITVQAWSPLAQGRAVGTQSKGQSDARVETVGKVVAEIAERKGVSREAVALAWLLRHPAGIQPVVGTMDPARISASCQSVNVELSREEWYALFIAGRGERLP